MPNLQIKLYCRYVLVCTGKNTVYVGVGTEVSDIYWGSWNIAPVNKGWTTVWKNDNNNYNYHLLSTDSVKLVIIFNL